jgi:hypothetical protein
MFFNDAKNSEQLSAEFVTLIQKINASIFVFTFYNQV